MKTINSLCFALMMIVMVNASKDEIRVILRDIKVHATSMKDRPDLRHINVIKIATGYTLCRPKFLCFAGKILENRTEDQVPHLVELLQMFHKKKYNSTCKVTNSSTTTHLHLMLEDILTCTKYQMENLTKP